jgi:aspartate-semialdehyde dehydrogenase
MSSKIKVGILGATGMVGQNYIRLLEGHPWFEVAYVPPPPNPREKNTKRRFPVDGI